jgi:ribosomal protein S12 methylthiotransferase accessory factor
MAASETLARVRPILADFGITRLARHTGLDRIGIPVWCAYTPNARSIVVAQGKGLHDDDAKVSAAMEALERTVANKPFIEPIWTSALRLRELGHRVEPLSGLIALHGKDIDQQEEVAWAVAKELLSATDIYVPLEAAILDRTRSGRFWMSSDGLASGNNLEEATLHGILERVERDAHVLWQIGSDERRFSQCIDPRAFRDPALDGLVERIDAAGCLLRLFDITSDIAIPCFTAILGPPNVRSGPDVRFVEVTGGSGAHPSPVRAAIRAITEAAQSRLTYISGARDDVLPETFLRPLPVQTRRAFDAVATVPATPTSTGPQMLRQLLEFTLNALREARVDTVAALPLGDPSLPFSVAKVFIPALENPDGQRARRYGSRAISKAIMA